MGSFGQLAKFAALRSANLQELASGARPTWACGPVEVTLWELLRYWVFLLSGEKI